MPKQVQTELESALAHTTHMHRMPCGFRHELTGGGDCHSSLRDNNLACAHSSSHKRLAHAIDLLQQAGHLDEESARNLQATVLDSKEQLGRLDALVANRVEDLSVDYPDSLDEAFIAHLLSDPSIVAILEQQTTLSTRLAAILGQVNEFANETVEP